jgi:hypothetical protein
MAMAFLTMELARYVTHDGDDGDDLPSLVSLGSLGSLGLSVSDVSKCDATMTTQCAVAETAMRQQRAGRVGANVLVTGNCGEQQ